MTTIFHEPERFGLTLVASHDAAPAYEFNTVAVWRSNETGFYYAGHDRGCSCPMPFEGASIDSLTRVRTLADVGTYARRMWEELNTDWYGDDANDAEHAVATLMDRLALKGLFDKDKAA